MNRSEYVKSVFVALALIAIPFFFDALRLQHFPAPASAGGEIVEPTGLFIALWRFAVRQSWWIWLISSASGYISFCWASSQRFKTVGLNSNLPWLPILLVAFLALAQSISGGAESAYVEAGNRMIEKEVQSPGLQARMLLIASYAVIFSLAAFSKEIEA
ncbi:hypothetical protein ABIE62_000899 [Porphyrobacter sp. MBR-155]|uniref:hypothetical protein n=1 Tax=Porphyrobacter sp. MBR-155 TaxID=3156464 RepID=UPI00339B2C9B